MAEKKQNWDKWIGAATGALGASAIRKVQKDTRAEARAMSYPKREVKYSQTPEENKASIKRMMESPTFGKVERKQSGSVGRPSAEKARDLRRQYEEFKKSR